MSPCVADCYDPKFSLDHRKRTQMPHIPTCPLPLHLPPLHLLRAQHLKARPKLLCLLPVPPHAPQRLRPASVLRRAPPPQAKPRLVFHKPESATVARLVGARRVGLGADDAPFDRVALVLDELLVYCVRDEWDGLAGEPQVGTEGRGKGLGRQRRKQVPLDVV